MRKYYVCNEFENIFSFRENTSEQLVLVFVNDKTKQYQLTNVGYCNDKLQKSITKKLNKHGYTQSMQSWNEFERSGNNA